VLEVRLPKTERARERMKKVPIETEDEHKAGAKGATQEKRRRK
jgi:hypothetical protein